MKARIIILPIISSEYLLIHLLIYILEVAWKHGRQKILIKMAYL